MSINSIKNKNFNLTIDGFSKSGKSACGRLIAKKIGFSFLDTGIFYRLFAWNLINEKISFDEFEIDQKKIVSEFSPEFKNNEFYLNDKKIIQENLHTYDVDVLVQKIATFKRVRKEITKLCQKIVSAQGFVIVGRDAGTVIDQDARIKFFFEISPKVQRQRMQRLFGEKSPEEISVQIRKRNLSDKTRKESPLKKSFDSVVFKNEDLTIDEAVTKLINIINTKLTENKPKVIIIGRVNAGKSSLFNLLVGENKTIVSREPNTTRDFLIKKIKWDGYHFSLVDTGGFTNKKQKNDFEIGIGRRLIKIVKQASVLIWVQDVCRDFDDESENMLKLIKKKIPQTIILLNKRDKYKNSLSDIVDRWKRTGVKKIYPFISKKKQNLTELKADIINILKTTSPSSGVNTGGKSFKVFILGKTNAGKSSLVNALTNEESSIVSADEHTTTNIVLNDFSFRKEVFRLFDTAGMRKSKKSQGELEKKSERKTQMELKNADFAIFLADATIIPTTQDKKIIQMIRENKIPFVLIGNKEDAILGNKKIKKQVFINFWNYLKSPDIFFISATKGTGIRSLKKKIFTFKKKMLKFPQEEKTNKFKTIKK